MIKSDGKRVGVFLFFLCAISAPASPLGLADYTAIVLKNNPQTKIASGSVAYSEAARLSAQSRMLPNINANAGISRSETPGAASRLSGVDNNSASAGISGQALLYHFGKTSGQLRAATKSVIAAQYDSQSIVATLILSARTAYYNYALSVQLLIVNTDAMKQAQIHYDQAKNLFDVGKQAQIEVTKALVDVANAEVALIDAKNALKLAKVQMDIAAGISLPEPIVLTDSLSALEDSVSLDQSRNSALSLLPEILSAQANLESARLQLKAVSVSYLPSLNATGSLWVGRQQRRCPPAIGFQRLAQCERWSGTFRSPFTRAAPSKLR